MVDGNQKGKMGAMTQEMEGGAKGNSYGWDGETHGQFQV